jgi:hypothetical protein
MAMLREIKDETTYYDIELDCAIRINAYFMKNQMRLFSRNFGAKSLSRFYAAARNLSF